MAFGNDEQFEIIVQRRGPDVRTAIYATQSVDILKGKFSWKVPKNMIEGLYFIRVRVTLLRFSQINMFTQISPSKKQ